MLIVKTWVGLFYKVLCINTMASFTNCIISLQYNNNYMSVWIENAVAVVGYLCYFSVSVTITKGDSQN